MIYLWGFNYNFYRIENVYFSKKDTSFNKYFFICPCNSTNFFFQKDYSKFKGKKGFGFITHDFLKLPLVS